MPRKPSIYYRPQNMSEAHEYLKQPDARPLAGGTKLIADGFTGAAVDLQDLGLDKIELDDEKLMAGAMTKLRVLSEFVREATARTDQNDLDGTAGLLLETIHRAGPNTYRNMATIGGILASDLPDSELQAALLILEAEVIMDGSKNFMSTEYLSSRSKPEGLIIEVQVPMQAGRWVAGSTAEGTAGLARI